METTPPRWDLSNVYPGLDSPALAKDIDWVKETTQSLKELYQEKLVKVHSGSSPERINEAISMLVDRMNALMEKATTVNAYLHSYVATDSFNQQATQLMSQFDRVLVGIQR